MRCLKCNSLRTFEFIDGFGEKRIFCKDCWESFPQNRIIETQRSLHDFNVKWYYRHDLHFR
ncbi:MAG: hypothetical protein QXG39_04590 [Candidatus Aenigmatarchaeota archaeon]